MAYKLIYSLAHLLIISLVYVEVTSKCRNLPEEKLEFKKLPGIWYIIQTDDAGEPARSCVKYNFVYSTTKDGEVITAHRVLNNVSQKKFVVTASNGKAKIVAVGNDGAYSSNEMILTIPFTNGKPTYYANYVCDPKSEDLGFMYVGVRNRSMEHVYNKLMMKRWEKLGFDKNEIHFIDQQNCPE